MSPFRIESSRQPKKMSCRSGKTVVAASRCIYPLNYNMGCTNLSSDKLVQIPLNSDICFLRPGKTRQIPHHFSRQQQSRRTGDKGHTAGDLPFAQGRRFRLPARGCQGLLPGVDHL